MPEPTEQRRSLWILKISPLGMPLISVGAGLLELIYRTGELQIDQAIFVVFVTSIVGLPVGLTAGLLVLIGALSHPNQWQRTTLYGVAVVCYLFLFISGITMAKDLDF
ncbi:MAG: hypothetical protein MPJ24_05030 [Pirellulaceae bacterium]|nr:hypothetical protein [Pirellulaceae bacterium]